jgi:hypothetical protein
MPLQNKHFDDVHAWTGSQRRVLFAGPAREAFPQKLAGEPRLFLLFHWDGKDSPQRYLKLVLRVGDSEAIPGPEGLKKNLPLFGKYQPADLDLAFLAGRQFVCTYATAEQNLVIEADVDTADNSFRALAGKSAGDGALIKLTAVGPPPAPGPRSSPPKVLVGDREFRVWFGPATPEPDFEGVVALDFGNTSSSLVYLSQVHPHSTPRPLRYFARGDQPDTVSTIVYLQKIGQKDRLRSSADTAPAETEAEIGSIGGANAITQGRLELGAKRQVVAPESLGNLRALFSSPSGHLEEVEFSRKLPADVFIHKLLRKFREDQESRPRPLAATYPTSYSQAEVEHYKQALTAAARRDTGDPSLQVEDVVRLMIDEASAACFYHIFHDLIDRPGGIYGARYLYPKGLNVLVFDCGGGTTDLALLHVDLHPDAESGAGRVDLKVLGRSGDRTFGGDQMTRQAFRLVKYGLAKAVLGSGGGSGGSRLGQEPNAAEGWPKFLADIEDRVEVLVPTRWNQPDGKPMNLDAAARQHRQRAVALLWEHAERLKLELAKPQPDASSTKATPELVEAMYALGLSKEKLPETKLANALTQDVATERLNALIGALLKRSLDKTNRLLDDLPARLGRKEHVIPQESQLPVVHRLYAVGNATRHPVVQNALKEKVNQRVRFRETRCIFPEERKLVVAQGASRALAAVLQYQKMVVRFDRHLVKKLAYDVTFYNTATHMEEPFYSEDTSVTQVAATQHTIPVPEPTAEDGPIELLRLRRRWPGDREGEPFLKFPFPGGVQGKAVTLSYRQDEQQFFIKDGGTEVAGQPEYEAEYVAPPQSGLL